MTQPNYISVYKQIPVEKTTAAYQELRQKVIGAGILKRAYYYYFSMIFLSIGGFLISWYFVYTSTNIFISFLWILVFVIFSVQVGGLMHDSGHRAIFNSAFWNDFWGHIFATLIGMPFGEWRKVHNQHHAHPNQDEEDPDIELPLVSLTKERYLRRRGLSKLIRPYQAYLWYPLGSLVSFTKRFFAIKYFKRNLSLKITPDFFMYLVGIFVWFVMPFVLLDWPRALFTLLTTNLLFGFYLANIFAPNHKGMPQLGKNVKLSFIEQQVLTSRNVSSGPVVDVAYIGLNYQIEHHLFPNCPRNKLKYVTPYAKAACKKLGLEFTEANVLESNILVLKELHEVVLEAKESQLALTT